MTIKRTKIEDTLDLPVNESELMKELEEKYGFSSDPNLSEIAKLALTAYKDQMMDIMHFEPKYRSRALEVAQQYLTLAKDAISKEEDLRIKENKSKPSEPGKEESGSESKTFDKNEILMELDNIRKANR